MKHDQEGEQHCPTHQEYRLDDLHPRRGNHAAGDDVDHHQDSDHGDRRIEVGTKNVPVEVGLQICVEGGDQNLDQASGPDHLGHHVRRADGDGRECSRRSDRHRRHPVSEYIGHRVLAGISHRLGDKEEHSEVGDEPTHRVHEAVVAVERDQPGDAQKGSRAHVVAGDGQAVLPTLDLAAGSPELDSGLCPARGPGGDYKRDSNDDQKEDQRDAHGYAPLPARARTFAARLSNTVFALRIYR